MLHEHTEVDKPNSIAFKDIVSSRTRKVQSRRNLAMVINRGRVARSDRRTAQCEMSKVEQSESILEPGLHVHCVSLQKIDDDYRLTSNLTPFLRKSLFTYTRIMSVARRYLIPLTYYKHGDHPTWPVRCRPLTDQGAKPFKPDCIVIVDMVKGLAAVRRKSTPSRNSHKACRYTPLNTAWQCRAPRPLVSRKRSM